MRVLALLLSMAVLCSAAELRTPLPPSFEKWHSVDIVLDGEHLKASIDGVLVQDVDLGANPELSQRLKCGFIGFPDMGHKAAFRNIRIADLGRRHKFFELFDGSTLNGWKLRGDPDLKKPRGFEVQIYSPVDSVFPTGSIYGIQRSRISGEYKERYRGSKCVTRIDGETVAETNKLPAELLQSGRIGLQIHMDDVSVEFRDIRVRSLE